MRLIVTRPQPEADKWVDAMKTAGLSALALPLIDIAFTPFVFDVSANYDAIMFVSRSAVTGFFQQAKMEMVKAARFMVTGLGSAEVLKNHGTSQQAIDMPDAIKGQFDSEALWHVVGKRDWKDQRVLVVRGSNALGEQEGRNWLANQLTEAGARVDFVVSYRRCLPVLTERDYEILQTPATSDLWLFSSSQAVAHLNLLVSSSDWSSAQALTTHPRIQIAAMDAGFGKVDVVRPILQDVISKCKNL